MDIKYDQDNDLLMIEGVEYSGDFFRTFASPNPGSLYRLTTKGSTVDIEAVLEGGHDHIRRLLEERDSVAMELSLLRFAMGKAVACVADGDAAGAAKILSSCAAARSNPVMLN